MLAYMVEIPEKVLKEYTIICTHSLEACVCSISQFTVCTCQSVYVWAVYMYTIVHQPVHSTGDEDKEKSVKQQFVGIETWRIYTEAHPVKKIIYIQLEEITVLCVCVCVCECVCVGVYVCMNVSECEWVWVGGREGIVD